jgi:hypothetical protein
MTAKSLVWAVEIPSGVWAVREARQVWAVREAKAKDATEEVYGTRPAFSLSETVLVLATRSNRYG